jgi:hypothetical protein
MAQNIDLSSVKTEYESVSEKIEASVSSASLSDVLQLFIDFYENTKIEGVDTDVPDNDMLLFEYGLFSFGPEQATEFTISFTRQFCIGEEEEYYQLVHTFSFDKERFVSVESFNKWSIDYPSLSEWKAAIRNTQGFQVGATIPWVASAVTLDYT